MKILVPSLWSDVTVGEFQQLASLDVNDKPYKRLADILSILCGVNSLELDMSTVKELEINLAFMNTDLPKDRLSSFKHKGIDYEWIKSLNEITLGEQISIEQTIEGESLDFANSFDLIMAVLLVEKGKKFEAKDINKNRELYSSFPIDKVHGMILFFLSGGSLFLKPSLQYLVTKKGIQTNGQKRKEKSIKRLVKIIITAVLSGLLWLIGLLKMILRSMK